jgi:hypothetical protein
MDHRAAFVGGLVVLYPERQWQRIAASRHLTLAAEFQGGGGAV